MLPVISFEPFSEMGSSDKAIKIAAIAVLASAAAYLGYRAYKKKYPFEIDDSKSEPVEIPNETKNTSVIGKLQLLCLILIYYQENAVLPILRLLSKKRFNNN